MALPLDKTLKIGVSTMYRRTEPAVGPWIPRIDEMVEVVSQVDRLGYDSFWVGDHISMAIPFLDPFQQIAQASVISRRLTFGIGVYLLPLRHPTPVAKQAATMDLLTEGRFIFGVGVGGEFPKEYEACGIPIAERGARLGESIEVLRKLWTGKPVSHDGRFFKFKDVKMEPAPRQPGGPPIWCGGRQEAALARAGRIGDGWISYAVSPEMYAKGMHVVARFGTAHLMFCRVDDSYEQALADCAQSLSVRYGMDMTPAVKRYGAIGRPQDVAGKIREYHAAGVRHIVLDLAGPYESRGAQFERFTAEVRPLLKDVM
jgi:probable F420-dependent oxidoreductase